MKRVALLVVLGTVAATVLVVSSFALANDTNPSGTKNQRERVFSDTLNGYQEAAPSSISSVATGTFEARIDDETQTITYTLTYEGIEGGPVTQAHIHFGSRGTNGGVSAFLCAGDKPPCPPGAAVITGVITAANVRGPDNQGIEQGNMPELIRAIRAGHTYVNVHSTRFPAGEIRAQIADRDQRQVH